MQRLSYSLPVNEVVARLPEVVHSNQWLLLIQNHHSKNSRLRKEGAKVETMVRLALVSILLTVNVVWFNSNMILERYSLDSSTKTVSVSRSITNMSLT